MNILGIIGIILLCILALIVFIILLILLICSFKTRLKIKIAPNEKELLVKHLFLEKDSSFFFGRKKVMELTLSDYLDILEILDYGVLRKMVFEKLHLLISVGTPSADITAQRYGQLTAAIFPLLGRLDAAGKIKDGKVSINPDFIKEKTEVLADVEISFRIINLVFGAIKVVFKIVNRKTS